MNSTHPTTAAIINILVARSRILSLHAVFKFPDFRFPQLFAHWFARYAFVWFGCRHHRYSLYVPFRYIVQAS